MTKMSIKILNIGLPRTGTYSLSVALAILGYKTKHYPSSLEEISSYDAACEVTFSYEDLEKSYPNSLYIFTTRNLDEWIASCYRHSTNKNRPGFRLMKWNPFWKDPNLWKNIYLEKKESIKKINKEKLLILDLNQNINWSKICNFLNKPIPDCSYPYLNKSYKFF